MGPTCEAGAYHLQPFMQNLVRKSAFYGKKIINHKDRQNFDTVVHIINAAPLINGAAATKCYIQILLIAFLINR